jgi:hypothetical protein
MTPSSPDPLTAHARVHEAIEVSLQESGYTYSPRLSRAADAAASAALAALPAPPDHRLREAERLLRAAGRGDWGQLPGRVWNEIDAALSEATPESAMCVCGANPPRRPWTEGANDDLCRDGNGNFLPGHRYLSEAIPSPDPEIASLRAALDPSPEGTSDAK